MSDESLCFLKSFELNLCKSIQLHLCGVMYVTSSCTCVGELK